jgi:hypothetical protein
VRGWLLDKSAAARSGDERVGSQLAELAGSLFLCPVGELEQLYSARSAKDYDALEADLRDTFEIVVTPPDLFERAHDLQRDWLTTTACGTERRSRISSSLARPCTTGSASSTSTATSSESRKSAHSPCAGWSRLRLGRSIEGPPSDQLSRG